MVCADQELRLQGDRVKAFVHPSAKLNARSPAPLRGFVRLGHGSGLPIDKGAQAGGWNDCAITDFARFESAFTDKLVNPGAPDAGHAASVRNAVGERVMAMGSRKAIICLGNHDLFVSIGVRQRPQLAAGVQFPVEGWMPGR